MSLSPASLPVNGNGGYYLPGATYGLARKLEVQDVYLDMVQSTYPNKPSIRQVASVAKVSHQYVSKIIDEIEKYGGVIDPKAEAERHQQSVDDVPALWPVYDLRFEDSAPLRDLWHLGAPYSCEQRTRS